MPRIVLAAKESIRIDVEMGGNNMTSIKNIHRDWGVVKVTLSIRHQKEVWMFCIGYILICRLLLT